jgi:pimeloyl-ACP methyl ester carboxylesterase
MTTTANPTAASNVQTIGFRARLEETVMSTVRSKDGTRIAFERAGNGPALILVDGALCHRASGPMRPLAALLTPHFTVYTYDRRGRGESSDTQPYSVQREVEDIEALIEEAGGSAYVFGISSGAALALEAAARGLPIGKLALYEAPFILDDGRPPMGEPYRTKLHDLIGRDRRSDAVKLFMKAVGVPAIFLAFMPLMPAWSKLKAVAHTLEYDAAVMGDTQDGRPLPAQAWNTATMPTLVVDGGNSPAWMRHANQSLSATLPSAQYRTLPGQTHMVKAEALAPALTEFFTR